MSQSILSQARQVYAQVLPNLLRRENVVACGIGYKVRGTEPTEELSLVVSVVKKVPESQLAPRDLIPSQVDGMLTDVVETGKIRALMAVPDPRARYRPAQPGVSIGHYRITAGTLGLLVQRGSEVFILSNNHVLANTNDAGIGDPIWQPGPMDGGTEVDYIATLADFVPLNFGEQEGECKIAETIAGFLNTLASATGSSHRLQAVQKTSSNNVMDVALALPNSPDLVIPSVLTLGMPAGTASPQLGTTIQKVGRTTGHTTGIVEQIDVTVNVDYSGRTVQFTDQVIASGMSKPGDSGSAIFNMQMQAVGLLFAGSELITIFTPLQPILDRFGVEVITD